MVTESKVKTIGVLTSGGDAPGMNAAIRAAVRRGLGRGVRMKGILKGYDGLMNEEIIDMSAKDVSDTIERGGTILYTARCAEMRTDEGLQKAAETCRKFGIDGLVSSEATALLRARRSWQTWALTRWAFRVPLIWTSPVRNIPSASIRRSTLPWKPSTR